MKDENTVLFVDDEEELRHAAQQTLSLADIDALTFENGAEALAHVNHTARAILVTDIRMPHMDGLTLLARALAIDPEFPVIVLTGFGDVPLAVRSMRDGAYDFLEKPYAPDQLVVAIRRAFDKRALTLENRRLRARLQGDDPIAARLSGHSAVMDELRARLAAVAPTEADVLIIGETGTGKEVAARALHAASPRKDRPFVAINCAALPEGQIESELFGHEPGAFPGAMRARMGKFEHAREGTVFLDEIDTLPPKLQAKLLHVVEHRSLTRLGSHEAIPLDTRFVAAAKADPTAAGAEVMRQDLLYRLAVVTLRMPPLSERREDIPLLFAELVAEAAARYDRPPPKVPEAVFSAVTAREWPGNARELRNAAQRYALGLDLSLPGSDAPSAGETLPERMAAFERGLIAASLAAHRGSLKATYAALGVSRKALYEKMQRHGLSRDAFCDDD